MTYREQFQRIMTYQPVDRMPVVHWTEWPETRERWRREGLPEAVATREAVREFLGCSNWIENVGVNVLLFPEFEEEVLEETEEYRVFRGSDGVVAKDWKHRSSIPHFIDYTFQTADDWPEYKKRLQPDPGRVWPDLDERIRRAERSGCPVAVATASLMGWTRNWMGVENMAYLMYDRRDVYKDIIDTLSDLSCWAIDQVIPRMSAPPDLGFGWEDICGKSGPLVSPDIFDECVAPGYRKVREKLESHGVRLLAVDSDGFIEPLLSHWLDAGVNIHFPLEIGTWNADPMALRKKFGRDLHIMGGYNKLALERGRAEIDAELERRLPIMRDGGFLLMPDHLITPQTPLDDYRYYLDRVRALRF